MPDIRLVWRVKNIDGVRTRVQIPMEFSKDGALAGGRKYVKARRCSAVFYTGRRAGLRCSWPAVEGREKCKRHLGNPNPTNTEARMAGHQAYWARMHALEQQYPGTIRRMLGHDKKSETVKNTKEIEATLLPRPKTKDPIVMKAHRALVREVAALGPLPNKKFKDMEPHEQQIHNTRLALKRSHEILEIKLTEKKIADNPKLASMVKDAALRTIATTVKIDGNALQARKLDRMGELLARLKAPEDAKLIEG